MKKIKLRKTCKNLSERRNLKNWKLLMSLVIEQIKINDCISMEKKAKKNLYKLLQIENLEIFTHVCD